MANFKIKTSDGNQAKVVKPQIKKKKTRARDLIN